MWLAALRPWSSWMPMAAPWKFPTANSWRTANGIGESWGYATGDLDVCVEPLWTLPSGNLLHSYGKIHHFLWENPLFLWPCSIAILTLPEGTSEVLKADGGWTGDNWCPWCPWFPSFFRNILDNHLGMGQNPVPLVNIKIAGIYGCSSPLKMVLIGIDPYPRLKPSWWLGTKA